MEIRQLRAFVTIADVRTFTAAAKSLGITQAAISMQIRQLEEELDMPVFTRTPRRVLLTEAGEALLGRARRILGEHDAALAEAAEYAGGEAGRLRIGSASGTFASEQLPGIMSALRRKHPKAELTVTPGTSKTLVEKVVHGDVDVAFVSLPVENASVVVEPLFTEKIVVIVPPGHELAKRRSVSAAALGGERLILGEQGGNTRRMIDAFFDSANVGANVSMELSRQEAVNRMVANGLGIGMAGARSVAGEVGRGTLVPIALEGADIRRELGLVRIRGGYFSPIAREFEALCKESFRDHGKKARRR